MIDILINLLTPMFEAMGASAADVSNYIRGLSGYIYAIFGLLAVMIAVMVAAHFVVKKGTRHVVRWSAVLAFVMAVVLIVNLICYGPMYATVSGVLNASRAEISDDVSGNSRAVIQRTGEEGMVLLKNTGLLPLKSDVSSLNVFGWSSAYPVLGGTGSAASGTVKGEMVGILDSLQNAGYATNEELTKLYTDYAAYWNGERPSITMNTQEWTCPEPAMENYTDAVMKNAKSFSDTAVIVIARSGGENADLPTDMGAVLKGTYDVAKTGIVQEAVSANYSYTAGYAYSNTPGVDDWQAGEHYLELSYTEKELVKLVTSNFSNVIVVINANNPMELGWVEDYSNIGAVILAPGTGATGMTALGEILNGTVNPSGKTVDTYVYDLTAVPNFHNSTNSGNHLYQNVGDITKVLAREDTTSQGVISFTDYVEGVYMGYKFYETASDDGVIDYDAAVQYPFGYGLSYTTFTQEITDFSESKDSVSLKVTVTNTGSVAGRDVVELYYTPPYTDGGIEKASVNLIDFEKTELLEPGASQTVGFTIAKEDMASYDSACIKTASGGYILEAGEYVLSIRSDSHTVLDSKSFTVASDIDYSKNGRSSDKVTATNQFDYIEGHGETLSRKGGFANYDKATAAPADDAFQMSKEQQNEIKAITTRYKSEDYDNPDDVMPTTGAKGNMTLSQLTGKSYDDSDWEKLLNQMTVDDMVTLVNTGGWQTAEISSIGKIATSDCDGPNGLSNYVTGSNGTRFTTSVMLAQTWSKEVAAAYGDALGQEFANANNYGWYGPAMNLHRSAFSGRNFEYFSEDAVLSGLMASQEVNAAARYGVYAYLKHFAANDQETNRCAFLLTYMTEQTLREDCLKPFEIVVKNFDFDSGVLGMMTAYNWLGTHPVICNSELLQTVLRDEWGFRGVVISDYNGSYGYQKTDSAIRNGNDLMLGYGMSESNKLENLESPTLVKALRQACKNILYTVANSGYYADGSAGNGGMSNMNKIFMAVDVCTVLLVCGMETLVILRWLKKKKAVVIVTETASEDPANS